MDLLLHLSARLLPEQTKSRGTPPGALGRPPPPSVFRRIVTFHIKWGPFKEQWEHVGEL